MPVDCLAEEVLQLPGFLLGVSARLGRNLGDGVDGEGVLGVDVRGAIRLAVAGTPVQERVGPADACAPGQEEGLVAGVGHVDLEVASVGGNGGDGDEVHVSQKANGLLRLPRARRLVLEAEGHKACRARVYRRVAADEHVPRSGCFGGGVDVDSVNDGRRPERNGEVERVQGKAVAVDDVHADNIVRVRGEGEGPPAQAIVQAEGDVVSSFHLDDVLRRRADADGLVELYGRDAGARFLGRVEGFGGDDGDGRTRVEEEAGLVSGGRGRSE